MSKVHYNNCPVCKSENIHPLLTVKDYSVSKEDFVICQCDVCTLRFTQDAPDEDSIATYYQSPDYISHTNTDKGLINKIYQKVRNHTLNQKAELVISKTFSKGSILDLGAGIGAFLNVMKSKEWQITGIEPDEGARTQAKKLFGLELQENSFIKNMQAQSFDAITLWHVLEHVHQLHDYIEILKVALKKEGKIFIAVPNYQSLDADIYKNSWAAYDVPRHLYHFTPKAIEFLMKEHDLKVSEIRPMWYDSFYISLLSSKYRFGAIQWFSSAINGLRSNINTLFNKNACSSLIYIIEKT